MRKRTLLITLPLLALAVGAAAIWIAGSRLIAVHPYPVTLPDLAAEAVALRGAPDQRIAGSYLAGRGHGAVLLLHGIHSDRRQMTGARASCSARDMPCC